MKRFDIKSDINEVTYEDEYKLLIREDGKKYKLNLSSEELIDLLQVIKNTVDDII